MEFWSKGLGRRSLVLELGVQKVECDEARMVLSGNVSAPVTWNYIMFLEPRDWTDLFELALGPSMASYLLCRRRLGALLRLTAFLARFLGLYLLALVRVSLGLAPEPPGVTATPDLRGRGQIDPAALGALSGGARSTRRPRPAGGSSPPDPSSAFQS